MIWPFLSFSVAAAGDPSSTLEILITNAGWIKSIPNPTGPNRFIVCNDFVSLGRVENNPGPS
jgi:hypothetical protein